MKTAVIAIGGNAIIKEDQRGTIPEQFENIMSSVDAILNLIEEGYEVILTHGNGPHMGNALIKGEIAKEIMPDYTMDTYGAETQGLIGYMIKQSFANRMKERGIDKEVAVVITQVLVDAKDKGFTVPTKPVGPFFSKEEADQLSKEKGYTMIEDSGRGYRKVVASPKPIEIIEKEMIKILSKKNYLVIAAGGGGIPVVLDGQSLKGIDAVIDKDYASSLLARKIEADLLIILTGVPQVSINFGKENQEALAQMTLKEAQTYMDDGQFPKGSMGPKIDAAMEYVKSGNGSVLITSIDKLKEAISGKTGTRIVP